MSFWTARDPRLTALRRFSLAITALTVAGHAFLGFETSLLHVVVALSAAYGTELFLELLDARAAKRRPGYAGGVVPFMDFLLSAHIGGLAVAMLLYPNGSLWPVAFAAATAIASKSIFRVNVNGRSRHFMNPSNTGIAATLLLFPWVGIAPPYQFTENTFGAWDGIIPAVIIVTGSILNAKLTRRVPLILAWLGGFVLQAAIRGWWFDTPVMAGLLPMTGMAFLLFTFYMVPDPGTTPMRTGSQVLFGAATAAVYGMLMALHVVFDLFFALVIVCAIRGLFLWARSLTPDPTRLPARPPGPAVLPLRGGAS